MRDEPGGRRFFVNDLNGPLYILDKQKKTVTTYLDFNGRGGRPGLFPKFTFELNFATGLTNFIFDPDYAKNGVFYTLHMEDPATDAPAAPKAGIVAGLDLTGYATTPAIPTPTVDGRLAADDGNPTTIAPIHEMDAGLRRITEGAYRERGGKGEAIPGMGAVAGRGRVDVRFAVDNDGALYVLTKSDGVIRKVVGARETTAPAPAGLRRCRVPVRTSAASQPQTSRIPWHRRPRRSPPGSGRSTPTALPATATWHKAP